MTHLSAASAQQHAPAYMPLSFNVVPALCNFHRAQTLAPQLLQAAQSVYDAWDETDVDTYAGGGVCHLIADALAGVLDTAGVEAVTVSSMHEQHVYVVCQLAEGVYELDIPYSLYELGAGYAWTKIQGVCFAEDDLVWHQLDASPEAFDNYID